MIGALAFLQFNSWKNRTLQRFRRLKQPKYLIGAIFGAAYFYFYFFRFLLRPIRPGQPTGPGGMGEWSADLPLLLESLGAVALFTFVVLGWVLPQERAALVFTEAEVAFLFPAPVSRRKLIHYKLLKSQMAVFFGTLILTVMTGRILQGGAAPFRVASWWLVLSLLDLHFLGASFARTRLLDRGISTWTRRLVVLGLVGGLVGWVGIWAWQTMPAPPEFNGNGDADLANLKYYARQLTQFGPVPYVLYPFRLVVKPYFAANWLDFLRAVWPVGVLMVLHYIWVVRANVAFEEASVEASRKLAERITAIRSGRRHPLQGTRKRSRPPFRLAPSGLPPVALLWKNLIAAGQGFTFRFWIMLLLIVVSVGFGVAPQMHRANNFSMVLGPLAVGLLAFSFVMGPQIMRQDFRQDLPMMDVLRTYPLPGWQLALGELLAPAAILTAAQWCLILFAILAFPSLGKGRLALDLRLALGFSLALLAPVLNLVSLIIPNVSVLLCPGWFHSGPQAMNAGIEATGQRIVFMLGQLLVLVASLLPAAILVAVAVLAGRALALPLSLTIPLAAVGATLIMAVEAALGLWWLGRLFAKFDLAAEGTGN